MASRHVIKYNIYEGKIITGHDPLLPIIRSYSDSMAYGDVIFPITETFSDDVSGLTCEIYKAAAPDTNESRWIKEETDLYSTSVCDFSGLLVDRYTYKITFKFLPASLSPSHGDFYSLEFFLTLNHSIPEIFSPKIIINIHNRLKF